jgi:glycosyltransferase involved in cell wall biosynthesis
VGNWNLSDYGRSLKEKYSLCENLLLLDPVYESHEINWIRSNAALYVHGHSAGGTNPSLVEAMNLGLPILAFDCVYNRATTQEKCLYWKTPADLQNLLQKDDSTFAEIGKIMLEEGKSLYSWKCIAEQYEKLYCGEK